MHRFTNILFCPLGDDDNAALVRRVTDLAARNNAKLTLFGVIEEPSWLQRAFHSEQYIDAIKDAERRWVEAKIADCGPPSAYVPTEYKVADGDAAFSIIEQVLADHHDLVVVSSDEDKEDHATIKRLLRKCPCPVWLIRPTGAKTQRVMAAVNPDPAEFELNRIILELAASMVGLYGGELHLVHAWELYGEATMRSSAFIHTTPEEIQALLADGERNHREALETMMAESGMESLPWEIHLHKGPPADVVRGVAAKFGINLLVIGTVARTGIAGLIMGNTAEAVLDSVRCSVIATKPPGFVSPVTSRLEVT